MHIYIYTYIYIYIYVERERKTHFHHRVLTQAAATRVPTPAADRGRRHAGLAPGEAGGPRSRQAAGGRGDQTRPAIDSPCECEHNNLDSLDARLFPSIVLAVAPAMTIDEASSLSPGTRLTLQRTKDHYASRVKPFNGLTQRQTRACS